MGDSRLELLIRAADAGDTYVSWTWLRDNCAPRAARLPLCDLSDALARLDDGLVVAGIGRDSVQLGSAATALPTGPMATYADEIALARQLTAAVLPDGLHDQIVKESERHALRIRVTPSPRLARVPWETLVLSDSRRLIEAAEIVLDPPTVLYARRSRIAPEWTRGLDYQALHVIDPQLANAARQVLSEEGEDCFAEHLAEQRRGGVQPGYAYALEPGARVTRALLSAALRSNPSRFFYFGHVSSDPDEPGTAALHLSDRASDHQRLTTKKTGNLPLSAVDLLLGTMLCDDASEWDKYGADAKQLGHLIWPMPSRVALVACEGGVDFRSSETFGLVIAMLDAGAELVTTTRWPLPTDRAFHDAGVSETVLPTTEMAIRIDLAHDAWDPVADLRAWQLEQLNCWTSESRTELRYSPVTWAALTHTCVSRR